MDPYFSRAWSNTGSALNRLDHFEEAINASKNATKIDSHFAVAGYNSGNSYGSSGRYAEAVEAYKMALQADPSFKKAEDMKNLTMFMVTGRN